MLASLRDPAAEDALIPLSALQRRLRRVARACLDLNQRVQNSVFECEVEPTQWTVLRARLVAGIDTQKDSLRFYQLGADGRRRVDHFGAKPILDIKGPADVLTRDGMSGCGFLPVALRIV